MFRKLGWSAASVALFFAGTSVCVAQEKAAKPVVSVAVSGIQELIDDLDYLGDLAGQPGTGQQLEAMSVFFTQGHGLEGVDRKRPWGGAVNASEDGQFQVLIFVPVANMEKLMATVAVFAGEPEDAGDGVWELAADRQSVFAKENDGWAYFAQSKEALESLPEDPVKMLGGLNERYDIAAQVHVQSLPEPMREMFIDQLRSGMEGSLDQEEGESDEQYKLRKSMAEHQLEAMSQGMNELDEVTVGWNVDRAGKRIYIDAITTALPGSKAAKQFAAYKANATPSKFAGFLVPEALFSLHAHSVLSEEDRAQTEEAVAAMRQQAMAALESDEDLGDDEKKMAEQLIEDLLELASAQLKNGSLSFGATVQGEGPINLVAGGAVADGALVEEKLKKWIALASQHEEFPKVSYNVGEHDGVKFHTASVPVPSDSDDREKVVALLGDKIDFTIGIGKDSAYFAVGPQGMDGIKEVMDASKQPGGTDASAPVNASLAVGQLLGLLAKVDEDNGDTFAKVAEAIKSAGNDHFRIETIMIENGGQYRILAEEGVVKAVAAVGKAQQQRQQQLGSDEEEDEDEAGDDDSDDDDDSEDDDEDEDDEEEDDKE